MRQIRRAIGFYAPRYNARRRSLIPVSPRSTVAIDLRFPIDLFQEFPLIDPDRFFDPLPLDDLEPEEEVLNVAAEIDNMAYANVSNRARAAFAHFYVPLTIFRDLIISVRSINFSAQNERQRVLQLIRDLPGDRVVSENTRFPEELCVDITAGVVADLLDTIRNACDFGLRGHDNVNHDKTNFGDARMAFTHAIRRLIELSEIDAAMLVAYRTFDRVTFENYYRLTWNA